MDQALPLDLAPAIPLADGQKLAWPAISVAPGTTALVLLQVLTYGGCFALIMQVAANRGRAQLLLELIFFGVAAGAHAVGARPQGGSRSDEKQDRAAYFGGRWRRAARQPTVRGLVSQRGTRSSAPPAPAGQHAHLLRNPRFELTRHDITSALRRGRPHFRSGDRLCPPATSATAGASSSCGEEGGKIGRPWCVRHRSKP